MATALDPRRSSQVRANAWEQSNAEFWFEAVTYRGFPVLAVPHEYFQLVQALLRERNREALSTTRISQ